MNDQLLNISLEQGEQFKQYQKKIRSGIISAQNREGFSNTLEDIEKRQAQLPINNQKDLEELKKLQDQFTELMKKFTELKTLRDNQSQESISRVSESNPYLRKNIRFTTGQICYVTSKGIAKLYSTIDDFDNTKGKNGCPIEVLQVNIPWIDDYNIKGTLIPTSPTLISGTPMKRGQACGNEGNNVYSTRFTDNIESSYLGCYRNYPQQENIVNLVPIMNSSNRVDNITAEASSIYLDNNQLFGPWRAFDGKNSASWGDNNSFWHSGVKSENIYNASTGVYTGRTTTNIIDKMNNPKTIKGETLSIIMNDKTSNLISYTIRPRQDGNLFNRRSPNTWYLLGLLDKNWYEIDFKSGVNFDKNPKTFTTFDGRKFNGFMLLITKVGNDNQNTNRQCVQITELQLNVGGDISSDLKAMMSTDLNFTPNIFDDCKKYAFQNNYKFFGLQDYDKQRNSAKCVVTNDLSKSMTYGDGMKVYKLKPIWATNTGGQPGNTATLSNTGSLQVINASGQVVYSSPGEKASSSYVGCYADRPTRAMQNTSNNKYLLFDQCKDLALQGNFKYFATQHRQGNKTGWCAASNNLNDATRWGKATNCGEVDGNIMGGGWSNAIYATGSDVNYFLIMQGDGNVVIYRGKGPNDNQGAIWSTRTNRKQQSPNEKYIASNNTYGRNWISSGQTLGAGDFISTNNGDLVLRMEDNGNLVLYTTTIANEGCIQKENTFGTSGTNAIYQLNQLPNKNYLGKFAYIDEDTNLREYKGDILTSSNEYIFFEDYDSPGNDIERINNTSREALIELCNKNDKCGGFIYNSKEKYGILKNKNIFPNEAGKYIPNSGLILGFRRSTLKMDTACTKKTNNVTAFEIEKYPIGENISDKSQCYTSFLPQQTIVTLDKYKNELLILSKDISNKMKNLYNTNTNIHSQLGMTKEEYDKNISMYENFDKKIGDDIQNLEIPKYNIEGMQNLSANDIDGMLTDADLRVLQENYSYFLWTILAVGSVAATINMMKK